MVRLKLILVAVVGGCVLAPVPEARAADLFTYSPEAPLTNEVVTFTAQTDGDITWDLDGDGLCDDAAGPTASRSFPTAGAHDVRMCVNGDEIINRRTVDVQNRTPTASFVYAPAAPLAGDVVTMTSTATDPDGPVAAQSWDLDGNGVFGDAFGASATRIFDRSGTYPLALQVTDSDGATAVAVESITVGRRPPALLSPLPMVRVDGRVVPRGVIVRVFAISAPRGVRVGIRCRGASCPYRRKRFTALRERTRVHSLERRLRTGVVIVVRVTEPGRIGKYTRLRIRRGNSPARVDRCLQPGRVVPVACPPAGDVPQ